MRSLDFGSVVQMWTVLRHTFDVPRARLAKSLLWKYGLRPLLGSIVAEMLGGIAPRMLDAKRRYSRSLPEWISADPELRDDIERHLEPTIPPREVGGLYLREVTRFLDHFLVSTEMELLFDYERHTGIPLRQPLFDPDLLAMLCRIAPELLNESGRSKGPARELLTKRFPELGFERQKKVMGTNYFRTVMMREGERGWKALGGIPALSDLGIVDPVKWSLTMESIVRNNRPQELFRFWCVLSVEAWLRART
jgi:hypothetical protein